MIKSKDLCVLTGAAIVGAQCTTLLIAIYIGANPLHYAYGFSLWGAFVSIPYLKANG